MLSENVIKFKELISSDEGLETFIRLYAPDLPERIRNMNGDYNSGRCKGDTLINTGRALLLFVSIEQDHPCKGWTRIGKGNEVSEGRAQSLVERLVHTTLYRNYNEDCLRHYKHALESLKSLFKHHGVNPKEIVIYSKDWYL